MNKFTFDEAKTLHKLAHYLPSQTPLKDFIHHNTLHAFQGMNFYDALFKASKIFGFKPTLPLKDFRKLIDTGRIDSTILARVISERKGEENTDYWLNKVVNESFDEHNEQRIGKLRANWKTIHHLDLDNLVQPLLFRILSNFLDQGIAIWEFPLGNIGFLDAIRNIEKNSFISLFKTKRASKLLCKEGLTIRELLEICVGDESYYEQYLFDQQFSHRGWSGMIATIEEKPETLLSKKMISLQDLIIFELLLEIDNLENELGTSFEPLSKNIHQDPIDLFQSIEKSELQEVLMILQDAFEWTYYDEILNALQQLHTNQKSSPKIAVEENSFQGLFCIDERECSIRSYIEYCDNRAATFGCPGFFGFEFYFKSLNAKFYDKLCPAPITPKYLVKEYGTSSEREHDSLYTDKTHQIFTGFLSTLTYGFWAGYRLIQNLFNPKMGVAISNAFAHMHSTSKLIIEHTPENSHEGDLQLGFTIKEMCDRVESLLRGIGLIDHFAPIIYLFAHGSSSANNPHHGAHDCGACSGRPGSVNSRVFSFAANHPKVRKMLSERGIHIPETTQFLGALHDTAADEVEYYDVDILTEVNQQNHLKNIVTIENALDLNAKERSRRFASIDTRDDIKKIRAAIKRRSVSLFEPRPELGHGTNSLCIVGERSMTKGIFLDRRAFLNSYHFKSDPSGVHLTNVMKPLGPVCGGINLEYYFSRVDNYKLGAGTKLPHNVVGLIGVANSSDGDLLPGLPWQMIEVHDPIRLLIIVEQTPELILNSIQSSPEMYEWYINEWVHLISVHPLTNQLTYFSKGSFIPYRTLSRIIHTQTDLNKILENAREMETNNIVHATEENLPVFLYQ